MLQAVKTLFKRYFILDKQRLGETESWSTLLPLPILLLLTVLGLTSFAALTSQASLSATRDQTIEKRVGQDVSKVKSSFDSYAQLLQGGVGLASAASVDSVSWRRYVTTFDIEHKFPAIYSFGVLRDVNPDEVDSFESQMSDDYQRPISVFPRTNTTRLSVVEFIEPATDVTTKTIGFDSQSLADRAKAINTATDTNEVALSDQLQLLRDPTIAAKDPKPAYIMYAPVYAMASPLATVEERQQAIRRHVFVSFTSQNFFESVFRGSDYNGVYLKIYGGAVNNKAIAYSSGDDPNPNPRVTTQALQLYGQTFILRYSFSTAKVLSATEMLAPYYIFIIGTLLSFILFILTLVSLRSRQRRSILEREQDLKMAQDELLSLASHQLRTPATGVKQYVGMILQGFAGDVTPQQKAFLQKAYNSNERQLHVINDILYLAKIDAGRIILAKTDFDLVKMIKESIDEQQAEATRAEIHIVYKGIKKAKVHADEHMLRMVFENLLSNALKYTDAGGRVAVALRLKGSTYELAVADNGVGVAEEDQPLLFQQFTRIPNPRSAQTSGTGVGLYLSKHLMLLHEGDIAVHSQAGVGSTFTVVLPKKM